MAYSKAFNFTPQAYHLSLVCKALSHPARVEILRTVVKYKAPNFIQIQKDIPLKQSTISYHIRLLRQMRILLSSEEDGIIIYKFNQDLATTIQDITRFLKQGYNKVNDEYVGENLLMERNQGLKSYTMY